MLWTQTSPKVRAGNVFEASVGSTAFTTLTILTVLFFWNWVIEKGLKKKIV